MQNDTTFNICIVNTIYKGIENPHLYSNSKNRAYILNYEIIILNIILNFKYKKGGDTLPNAKIS